MSEVAAIVLAAGTASRYRALDPTVASKLVAMFRDAPMVRHAVEAALASRAAPVLVVTGHARADVEAALAGLAVRFIHNPEYGSGLASSLQAGVAALPAATAGVVVMLGDMPLVDAHVINLLVDAAAEAPNSAIVPVLNGTRGNPVLLPRSLFAEVMRLKGDEGARRLLNRSAIVRELTIDNEAIAKDVDTPAGLTS